MQNVLMEPAVRVQEIGPEDAKEMLDRVHPNQRKISPVRVSYYSDLMRQGKFLLSQDAIAFDENRMLVNGQHRLEAVVESGTVQSFLVVSRLSADAIFEAIDQNKTRTIGDLLDMRGDIPGSRNVGATIAKIFRFDNGVSEERALSNKGRGSGFISATEIAEFYYANTARIQRALSVGTALSSSEGHAKLFTSRSTPAMLFFITARANDAAEEFFQNLLAGESLANGNPIFPLRETLIQSVADKKRFSQNQIVAFTIAAFNAFSGGYPLSRISLLRAGNKRQSVVRTKAIPQESIFKRRG